MADSGMEVCNIGVCGSYMEQLERIQRMEARLDEVSKVIEELSIALEHYHEIQEDIKLLEAYYGSADWKKDYADDEAGKLPADLKRGVLSEDAVYNLLANNNDLKEQLKF